MWGVWILCRLNSREEVRADGSGGDFSGRHCSPCLVRTQMLGPRNELVGFIPRFRGHPAFPCIAPTAVRAPAVTVRPLCFSPTPQKMSSRFLYISMNTHVCIVTEHIIVIHLFKERTQVKCLEQCQAQAKCSKTISW